MKDIVLHSLAAIVLTLLALSGAIGLVAAITIMWLLRELAQRDKSNLWAAMASMPHWSLAKHAEWLAPGFVAACTIAVQQAFWGPLKALLTPL